MFDTAGPESFIQSEKEKKVLFHSINIKKKMYINEVKMKVKWNANVIENKNKIKNANEYESKNEMENRYEIKTLLKKK